MDLWHILQLIVVLNLVMIRAHAERDRVYYIGVEEIDWNYTPSMENVITDAPFDSNGYEADYVIRGPGRIGSTYRKAVYRQYTDNTYTEKVDHPEHLGILGPVLMAEVGDRLVLHFKNTGSYPATMHPHGVFYNKNSEGAIYEDNTDGSDKADDGVKPGDSHTYIWVAKERAGPTKDEDGCAHWLYHSHIESTIGTNSGLLGPMLICRRGFLRPDGSRRDVDRVFFLMMTVIDENSSHYIEANVRTYIGDDPDFDLEDEGFLESNLMRSINGYMYGNLPGLDMCMGERVEWNIFSTGTEVDVHSVTFYGNFVNFRGHTEKTIAITPAVTLNALMLARNQGTWLLTSDVVTHFWAGMQALYTVNSCNWSPSKPDGLTGTVRRYYIAAVEMEWNYAPSGMNGEYNLTDDNRPESTYFSKTGNRIGGTYLKALYREFEDDSFTAMKARTGNEEHLGFLGPVIRAEVGDTIEVVFLNDASQPYSIHPSGVHYDKANEGAMYNDGSTDHSDDLVAPGSMYNYTWTVPPYLAPTNLDRSCVMNIYHSHVDPVRDPYSGLIGPLLVCKTGSLEGNKERGVDKEFSLLFMNVDENLSHYLSENIQKYTDEPNEVDIEDGDFIESNTMRGINGYLYSNLPGLDVCAGDSVAWHVASFGKENDMHMAVFEQQSVISGGLRRDEVPLFPGTSRSFEISEVTPGEWTIYCYVATHFDGGTRATINVDENCGEYTPVEGQAESVFYIAAEERQWDYAPVRYDPVRSQSLDDAESPGNVFVRKDDHLLGSTYAKAIFLQYTDSDFSEPSPREESWGILGNPIHVEVGEIFQVVFRNRASRHYGFYAHGVRWINFDQDVFENGVAPDETFRYDFVATEGPSDTEAACTPFLYTSMVDLVKDTASGLVGPLIVCREGILENGRRLDVSKELYLFFMVLDENKSWYLDENIQTYAGKPSEVDTSDPEFEESNLMHGINGLLYNNLKGLSVNLNQTTEWYLMGLGDEVDLHTVHFHGQTILYRHERQHVADVYELGPGITAAVRMIPDDPGQWLLHCHVNDHILGGMETTFTVSEPEMGGSSILRALPAVFCLTILLHVYLWFY